MQLYEYVFLFLIITSIFYWISSTKKINVIYSDPTRSINVFNIGNKKNNLVDFSCTPENNNCTFYIE
jgi:hypothetical protein